MRPFLQTLRSLRPVTGEVWRRKFWWQWVAANGVAELLGLGTVALVGFGIATRVGEPQGVAQSIAFATLFVFLGAFEGLVVGLAQQKVLRWRLPGLQGWVRASVVGAVAAWALGMTPSTIMSLADSSHSGPPPQFSEPLRLLFAVGIGLVAGPLLAFFQWRRLRACVTQRAAWWLPANALAWALGMPLIFVGAHTATFTANPLLVALGVGLSLLTAGAVVGAVHGGVLVWMLSAATPGGKAA